MTRLSDRAARQRLLWLDHQAYSAQLLAGGNYPWLDTAACVSSLRQAHSLLRPDVMVLPLGDVAQAWLDRDPGLREIMAGKTRRAHGPLKELLASAGLRAQALALATALRAAVADTLLVLALPSPRDWVAQALISVGDPAADEVDEDAVDAGAACMADFLRPFASLGVDAVLMRESTPWASDQAELWLELYQPVANVARHYGWAWGLQMPQVCELPAGPPDRFVLAPAPCGTGLQGVMVHPDFWETGLTAAGPVDCFDVVEIPADAKPETVLARLAQLRDR